MSDLINEYGAGCTPLLRDLDAHTGPVLRELENWAMGIPEMDGRDWAILRTYVTAEFEQRAIVSHPITDDGHWFNWIHTTRKFIDKLRREKDEWIYHNPQTHDWECAFIGQWVHGGLTSMCAQIQIKKAMQQRKEKTK